MSMTKATTLTKTSTKPRYLSPDASRKLIPKMWATNMERLGSLMREIPDEVAAEDIAQEWMDEYYEVSDHIEGLWQFTTDLSTKVPDYPEETQEAIGSGFLELPAPGRTGGSQAGGETTRRSQQQLEKAAARGNEGDKDLPTSGGSAPIEAAATSLEESAAQGSGGGMEVPTLSMQVETEACKRQEAKESQRSPGVGFNEQEGEDDACPPSLVFSSPKGHFKAAEAAPSLPMPQDIPSAPVLTLPGIPLFLPSSHPTTPTPTSNPQDPTPPPSPVDHNTVDVSAVFIPVPGRILDEGNMGTDDTPADIEEIDLTTPCASPLPEEDVPRA
ncbi:hypothetical protein PISMIDRAFT_18854 [Pisolithus microcarpus 441]|uniref:Uncharacterized protein n=1 Tax=Pisolithus microcarpus 441 TaxID=765257 RepID=A0A0C9XIX2_9AGAM|nr:hypothetical protein PISMIDRAFT_18854 [Pisolithus microcarpus 441]